MVVTRYEFARNNATGGLAVEIGCGAGHGLPAIGGRKVIGLDITHSLLSEARRSFDNRFPLVQADGCRIPLRNNSVDTVIIFEALYYFPNVDGVLSEAERVLKNGGKLLVCWPNPLHDEFIRGALTHTYPTLTDFQNIFKRRSFASITFYGGFKSSARSALGIVRLALKKISRRLRLIPAGMKSKAWLKKMFYAQLAPFPRDVSQILANAQPLAPLQMDSTQYRILYLVATK